MGVSAIFHSTIGKIYAELKDVYYKSFIGALNSGNFIAYMNRAYVSQFADAKNELIIDPYKDIRDKNAAKRFGANLSEFSYWAGRSCAIACLQMIMKTTNKKFNESTMDLVSKAYSLGGYDTTNDRGWYHEPLIKLARKYGLSGKSRKFVSAHEIVLMLLSHSFVISSIKCKTDTNTDSHHIWIYGFKIDHKHNLAGFWVNDPANRITGKDKFIKIDRFNDMSTRRVIEYNLAK